MEQLAAIIKKYLIYLSFPQRIILTDVVEILIISFLVYQVLLWIKNTRGWSLLRGIIVIGVFIFITAIFRMTTIIWLAQKIFNVAIIAAVVIFQPELRKALEQLGRKKLLATLIPFEAGRITNELFSDKTIDEMIRAAYEMGKVKTGALIVIQQTNSLSEYIKTGIAVDAVVSSQLLINIFEHNTPLHDGAVIVSADRIVAATCYLPLSDSTRLSKDLGTRHRAALGISEATDSLTIIVSEETGRVSAALDGHLYRSIDAGTLREKLELIQNKKVEEKKFKLWKGRPKDGE